MVKQIKTNRQACLFMIGVVNSFISIIFSFFRTVVITLITCSIIQLSTSYDNQWNDHGNQRSRSQSQSQQYNRNNHQNKAKISYYQLLGHLNHHFSQTSELNKQFVDYIDANGGDFGKFYLNPKDFYGMTTDYFIQGFIHKYRVYAVEDSLTILVHEKDIKYYLNRLSQYGILDKINVEMMFVPANRDNFIYKQILLDDIRRKFYKKFVDNQNLIEKFISHLSKTFMSATDIGKYNPDNLKELNNDPIMRRFIDENKEQQARILNRFKNEDLNLMKNHNIYNQIDAPMMFDKRLMTSFLSKFLLARLMEQNLNRQFPDATNVNKWFVDFLDKNNVPDMKRYDLTQESLFNLENETLMREFVRQFGNQQVRVILKKLNPQFVEQDFVRLNQSGFIHSINLEMMFVPPTMESYLKKEFVKDCQREFSSLKLIDQTEEWGKTPDKCIFDPICENVKNFLIPDEKEKIKNELKNFPIALRSFDEVDEMFFDLISDDVQDHYQFNFQGDVDCLIAYIKRTNNEKKWYNIDLITNDEERKKKLKEIIAAFDESVEAARGKNVNFVHVYDANSPIHSLTNSQTYDRQLNHYTTQTPSLPQQQYGYQQHNKGNNAGLGSGSIAQTNHQNYPSYANLNNQGYQG